MCARKTIGKSAHKSFAFLKQSAGNKNTDKRA